MPRYHNYSDGSSIQFTQEEEEKHNLLEIEEMREQKIQKANDEYEAKRSDVTVVYFGATFRWHKIRHWEDWHRKVTLGNGCAWFSEEKQLIILSHQDMINICALIEIEHQNAFIEYWQKVNG